MPSYTRTTWVNGTTPANATNLNNIESQLASVQFGMNIITPFQLANNTSISSGATTTYTCTGVGGVPSGAVAVFVSGQFTASAINTQALFTPHSVTWNNDNYPSVNAQVASITTFAFMLPLSVSGQIDVKSTTGNMTAFFLWMYAYVF